MQQAAVARWGLARGRGGGDGGFWRQGNARAETSTEGSVRRCVEIVALVIWGNGGWLASSIKAYGQGDFRHNRHHWMKNVNTIAVRGIQHK